MKNVTSLTGLIILDLAVGFFWIQTAIKPLCLAHAYLGPLNMNFLLDYFHLTYTQENESNVQLVTNRRSLLD